MQPQPTPARFRNVLRAMGLALALMLALAAPAYADHGTAPVGRPDNARHCVDRNNIERFTNYAVLHGIAQLNRTEEIDARLDCSGDVEVKDGHYGFAGRWAPDENGNLPAAKASCLHWKDGNRTANVCDVYLIEVNLDVTKDLTIFEMKSIGCHEFGHTAGLHHRSAESDNYSPSCMRSGFSEGLQTLDNHDLASIDAQIWQSRQALEPVRPTDPDPDPTPPTQSTYVNDGGLLYEVSQDQSGATTRMYTGIDVGAGSPISATYVAGNWARIYANINGYLHEVAASSTGWKKEYTGIQIPAGSPISATHVNSEGWGRVYVNINGALHEIAVHGGTTWKMTYTGVQGLGDKTPISATHVNSEGWGRVYVNINGALHEIAVHGNTTWKMTYTGVQGLGDKTPISATHVNSEGWGRVYANINGYLHEIAVHGGTTWKKEYTGIQGLAESAISATHVGSEGWGRVYVNLNGALQEVKTTSTGWAMSHTGVQVGAGLPISATYVS